MTKDEKWLLEEKYSGVETLEFEVDRTRLATGEPVAYLIGFQPFLGLKIYLDSLPLIPRPETEWWTEQMLSDIGASARRESRSRATKVSYERSELETGSTPVVPAREEAIFQQENTPLSSSESPTSPLNFLDLCAGSGAIGCAALAHLPQARVFFGEIDPTHETTISKNIRENNLDESRANIRIGDLFEPFENMQFDIIVVNPPYIPVSRPLPASVSDYEPSQALYAGADGLDIIRRIAVELPHRLAMGGGAWIEIDSAHAAAACALFTDQGLHAEIRTDQYGKPRVIVVSLT